MRRRETPVTAHQNQGCLAKFMRPMMTYGLDLFKSHRYDAGASCLSECHPRIGRIRVVGSGHALPAIESDYTFHGALR